MPHYDLVIIGSGSGNSIIDERFDDWNIAIVEKGVFGGTCLNVGCIPTKMFVHPAELASSPKAAAKLGVDLELHGVRWAEVRDRVFGRIDPIAAGGQRYRAQECPNVTVYSGEAKFTGPKQLDTGTGVTITADRFVIAAGSRPVVPSVAGIDEVGYHTNETVMRLAELPARMVILGGGFVATEFAHVFSSFGVQVTVVNRSGALLRAEDADVSARFTELVSQRWDVRLNRKALRAERVDGVVRLHLEGPEGAEVVEAEELLVAAGRIPNAQLLEVEATGVRTHADGRIVVDQHQRTEVEGIFALGDVSSPHQLKHVANHEAKIVQHNLLHPESPRTTDHRFVPHAVFSSPQVASVGLTEDQAKAAGLAHVAVTQEYAGIAYGWAMEDTTGFCKLIADPVTGQLLGAHIIGPQASTLIQPLIQAMHFGLDARTMARGQYWIHPAMPELIENALLKI
ncbi:MULTISPECIES: mycothione reductase [unclassified Crossiella]|uniref:mycothione reductase n=1 Tax=unclassified Crossiella TaxID=2620835 RepID=UPI001FFF6A78|nr:MULTISPECIES: mycothione reductase [unclassified Crossiella]MCK2242531.1 mycothione reductase [Crossiella sp. S99.2]MCK2254439.1 mycothione reductase [Crossiella sp. S99.1]